MSSYEVTSCLAESGDTDLTPDFTHSNSISKMSAISNLSKS